MASVTEVLDHYVNNVDCGPMWNIQPHKRLSKLVHNELKSKNRKEFINFLMKIYEENKLSVENISIYFEGKK